MRIERRCAASSSRVVSDASPDDQPDTAAAAPHTRGRGLRGTLLPDEMRAALETGDTPGVGRRPARLAGRTQSP
jgi:hypothetical protein